MQLLTFVQLLLFLLIAALHPRSVGIDVVKRLLPLIESLLRLCRAPEDSALRRIAGCFAAAESSSRYGDARYQERRFHSLRCLSHLVNSVTD